MKTQKIPSYGLHKASGQARVYVDGRSVYLGPFGSDESRRAYGDIVGKLVGGQKIDPIARKNAGSSTCPNDPGPSVGELCVVFLRHAETHYVKNGKQTSEVHILKSVIKPLNELYGMTPAAEFGPLALKAVRQRMIELGWARCTINTGMSRIRRIFKHAIANELIGASVLERLRCVAPLLSGRTEARDNDPRTAVSDEHIEAVRSRVSSLVKDLIDLQRLSGARSGELVMLTGSMIDRTDDVWSAELTDNKCRHHGKTRTLHFGPKAQLILRKYLSADPDVPLFAISRCAYCRAVTRACDKAKIPRWVPHQLRHTAAENVRQEFGLEHTQSVLGHSKANMTEHYAKAGKRRAAEVARKIG